MSKYPTKSDMAKGVFLHTDGYVYVALGGDSRLDISIERFRTKHNCLCILCHLTKQEYFTSAMAHELLKIVNDYYGYDIYAQPCL